MSIEKVFIKNSQSLMVETTSFLDERYKSKKIFSGIPTGFEKLDYLTLGFQKSDLIAIGSQPWIGKSALALSMIQTIALKQNIPCALFSLETPCERVGLRLVSQNTKISQSKLMTGMYKKPEFDKISQAANLWYKAPLYIADKPDVTFSELEQTIKFLVNEKQVKIVFIDSLDFIIPESTQSSVREQMSEISRFLKVLARTLDIPIVVLFELPQGFHAKRADHSILKYMNGIEHKADVILLLHRDLSKHNASSPWQQAKIIIAKQRLGPTGEFNIKYYPEFALFEDLYH